MLATYAGRINREVQGFFVDFDVYSYCAGEVWPIRQLYRDKPIGRCAVAIRIDVVSRKGQPSRGIGYETHNDLFGDRRLAARRSGFSSGVHAGLSDITDALGRSTPGWWRDGDGPDPDDARATSGGAYPR